MKSIRLQLFQQLVNYRKPNSNVGETYHLPNYSTIIGMIHAACKYKSYHEMKISVQGEYSSIVSNLETLHIVGDKYDKGRHTSWAKGSKGERIGIFDTIQSKQLLCNVNLIIHMTTEDENELEYIKESLMYPENYLSLGRHQDLVRIDNVEIVDLEETEEDEMITTKYNTYIPMVMLDETDNYNVVGGIEKVRKKYVINKRGTRDWVEVIKCKYVSPGEAVILTNGYRDKELNLPVCFA